MASIKIRFDAANQPEQPTLVLAKRNGKKIGLFDNTSNVHLVDNLNSAAELSFALHKSMDSQISHIWNEVTDFRLAWCKEWDKWFSIKVEITSENGNIVKNVSAISLAEWELSNIKLWGVEINTEADIARDDYVSPTIFYDPDNPDCSFLHRILSKFPAYTIKHVDYTLERIQRYFSFNGSSIYDALQEAGTEINAIIIYNSGTTDDGKIERSISVYDLQRTCLDCDYRDDFVGSCPKCGSNNIHEAYGRDTTILISDEALANSITLTSDTDSVKNCFRLTAGDELMTATVRNCNPNGSAYIWHIPDSMKGDMSDELVEKLANYDADYDYYYNDYLMEIPVESVSKYNQLVSKYKVYDEELQEISLETAGYANLMLSYYNVIDFELYLQSELMPTIKMSDTSAEEQAALLTSESLSPVAVQDLSKASQATANNAVLGMAKAIIDNRYQVKIVSSEYNTGNWVGTFSITNYSDEEDTFVTSEIAVIITDDYEEFTYQKIQKTMSKHTAVTADITDLFALELNEFKNEIKQYGLSSLESFYGACQACLNILIEQGIANPSSGVDYNLDLYERLYLPYYNKNLALMDEIKLRESEIAVITELMEQLDDIRNFVAEKLDMENYLGKELWIELSLFRMEDEYSNSNYISDGLNNAELFNIALKFIEVARKEVIKASNKQHSISTSLHNLLAIKEFLPLTEHFQTGNWIRITIDDVIYKLKLLSYSIGFDNISEIDVEFSDTNTIFDTSTSLENVIAAAGSMAKSYDSVKHQAEKGASGYAMVDRIATKGLDLTTSKIMNTASNQTFIMDEHGLLCREYNPILDSYSDEQIKIINSTLAFTTDAWKTSKAALGRFYYFDPKDKKMKEGYGVVADTIVGNIVLSEEVGIYNQNNSITLDHNGLTITANGDDKVNNSTFVIQKQTTKNGQPVIEKQLYLDEEGNLIANLASLQINSSNVVDYVSQNIDVGARNLALGTEFWDNRAWENRGATAPYDNNAIMLTTADPVNQTSGISVVSNLTYILGIDIRADEAFTPTDGILQINFIDTNKNQLYSQWVTGDYTTKWNRISHVFVVPDDDNISHATISFPNTDNKTIYFRYLKVESGTIATDWTPAPEDIEAKTNTELEFYYKNVQSSIDQTSEAIKSTVAAIEATNTQLERVSTTLTQNQENFEFNFNKSVSDLSEGIGLVQNNLDTTKKEVDTIHSYITFNEEGITLGEAGNELTLKIEKDQIVFKQGEQNVAWFSNNQLHVTDVNANTSLSIGRLKFTPRENGSLDMNYI